MPQHKKYFMNFISHLVSATKSKRRKTHLQVLCFRNPYSKGTTAKHSRCRERVLLSRPAGGREHVRSRQQWEENSL